MYNITCIYVFQCRNSLLASALHKAFESGLRQPTPPSLDSFAKAVAKKVDEYAAKAQIIRQTVR